MIPSFEGPALSLLIERFAGYPDAVYRLTGHPVEWMGRWLTDLERRLFRQGVTQREGRLRGTAALGLMLLPMLAASLAIHLALSQVAFGWIVEALIATVFIAQKSLRDHVTAVADGLDVGIEEGREAVARIVGRDPAQLDESGVSRAALESLAENFSDGVVAPVLWYVLLGLPGIALYKAINTADSMIGHRTERYRDFGWAAARLDDVVNLPASRLTAVLIGAAARMPFASVWETVRRDAPRHLSPNAGWPEAALAAGLDIRLGGPRSYDGLSVDLATMGDGRDELSRDDIRGGLALYDRALSLLFLVVLAGTILI